MDDTLAPKDHAEAVAHFRAQVLGPLLARPPHEHGQLAEMLRELSAEPVRPPGASATRTYAASTLERWLYDYRRDGIDGLRPRHKKRGHALELTAEQRELLLQIRREHPRTPASVILRTLIADGRLQADAISEATLRRLYLAEGLDRLSLAASSTEPRKRWVAQAPNAIWHADVCHGPSLRVEGRSVPLRVHGILDDHSRYLVALQAASTEREIEMLLLLVNAIRIYGIPEVLYLDNGATYSGRTLATFCARIGIVLIHAKPYDAQARGKMERLWRTLRQQCLDHCEALGSLHDAQVRLSAWLDTHYHATPHAALMGRAPALVYEQGDDSRRVSEAMLAEALTVRQRRRVRRDCTVSVAGVDFELDHGYLAGQRVVVGRTLLDPSSSPWVEHEQQRLVLRPVDPQANARRHKPKRQSTPLDAVDFDPPGALLGRYLKGAS